MLTGTVLMFWLFSAAAQTEQHEPGSIFINELKSKDRMEFVGGGSRPVDNHMVDKNSVYQDVNRTDPTEFGAGMKFNATDDFSISIQAGGELIEQQNVEVDSGALVFEFSY
ncbi:hypothetical protein VV869_05785 [Photobacterium sp. MCCC 1A19761]|uniref:hypothetical protein n=1 Tax=Photobacterium sp. MCCC 1A19761 TaxID=3115000 RepID=UPI00307CDBB4